MFRNKFFIIIFSIIIFFLLQSDAVVVQIKSGKLKGATVTSRNGTKYYAFFGIPFAKPPIGDLRFEPPQEENSWDGIRDATIPPPPCIQKDCIFSKNVLATPILGQEDCLYLNVFTPNIKKVKHKLLPTVVIIHGGAFITGSSMFQDPQYFMDFPVVIVSIQYRLSIFGFLSAVDDVLPGNYGMKDQVAALKWVQKNIESFGGDPNQVTICGESAGGGSVHLHMHSPLSKGLFHRAISQSGSALAQWVQTSPKLARAKAYSFAIHNGCPIDSTRAIVNCLKKIPAEELMETHHKFYVFHFEPTIHFSSVIESKTVPGAFLIENPWIQGELSDVPFIIGMNSGEGGIKVAAYLLDSEKLKYLNKNYERIFPLLLLYYQWTPAEKHSHVAKAIKEFYFGEEDINEKTALNLVNLITDGYFTFDCIQAALRHSTNTYFYYYDHRNVQTFNELFGFYKEDLGVCHADDLISLFYLPTLFEKVTEGDDFEVSQRMVNYWINFIKTGNPNGDGDLWQPLKSEEFEYLHITTKEDKMKKRLLKERYEFWKSLPIYLSRQTENFHTAKDEL
ncbi:hypothetical protein PGB90_003063 [Kerria lacca]